MHQEQGDALVAAALGAPTFAQPGGRAEHADLLPLFADEASAFHSSTSRSWPWTLTGRGTSSATRRCCARHGRPAPSSRARCSPPRSRPAGCTSWTVGRTTALHGAAGWLGDAMLFVDFLPTTIYRPQMCLRTTEQAARRAGVRLDQLVFEVTESERVTDLEHLAQLFGYYREQGCEVALDDLGAGYSSLNVLVQLQPDVVKLDKAIVQRLPDAVSAAVVTAVVEFAHSYGGLVLAECVETADQVTPAEDLGVDLAQGWTSAGPRGRGPRWAGRPPRRAVEEVSGWPRASSFSGDDPAVGLPDARPVQAPVTTGELSGAAS